MGEASDGSGSGDVIRRQFDSEQRTYETGKRYHITFKRPPEVRLCLKDDEDKPLVQVRYELKVGEKSFAGSTDDEGILRHRVDPAAESGILTVWLEDCAEETEEVRERSLVYEVALED